MRIERSRPLPGWPATLLVLTLGWPLAARGALPKVPEGFEVRLVATVPAVHYPCQVATAPDGSLYVAEDPMDQVGPYESFHGRILLFRDGKDPVPYADNFRAIQGMAWHQNALYVSHMPFLTVLRDTNGDGKPDERKDLFQDLGPTNNQGLNDHIVSGIQFGMDGYLYISVGDKGIPRATGPDGRTIQVLGGGTCRCRPDGTGLEVFSTGTRNHLEANLNDRDELFTYDNTDDGLGWWTRVTHHIDGGDYGYPYDYHPRPDRHLPRMAEYGGGSPCGALIYKEDAWPEKYRNVGFWAEWGKGKVHAFRFEPDGATYKVAEEIDFAVAGDGLSNFRPIDLALSYDGRTMYVADWNMGGWGSKTEKVGRVYAITNKSERKTRPRGRDSDPIEAQIKQLDHPSFNERMRAQEALIKKGRAALPALKAAWDRSETGPVARRHLIWTIDGIAGGTPEATAPLVAALKSPVADVRAQAARALGERRLRVAGPDVGLLVTDPEPSVRLQAIIALGRIGVGASVGLLPPALADKDLFLSFAARQALRRIGDWKTTAALFGSPDPKVRAATLAALELVYDRAAVELLQSEVRDRNHSSEERAKALFYLAQAHRKTKPWDGHWWGTRPADGKPPAKVVDWEGTPIVLATIRESLADDAGAVRLAAVAAVQETGDRESLAALRTRFGAEGDTSLRVEIAKTFGVLEDKPALPLLIAAMKDPKTPDLVRDAALASVEKIGTDLAVSALIELLDKDGLSPERRPRVIAALGRFKAKAAVPSLVLALKGPAPAVRAASAEALGKIGGLEKAGAPLRALLDDKSLEVRKSAIAALGALSDREAIPPLLAAAHTEETRFEATLALSAMPDLRALQVYLRGLADKSPDVRKAAAAAVNKISGQAALVLEQLANRKELAPAVIPELQKIFTATVPVTDWRLLGPFDEKAKNPLAPRDPIDPSAKYPALGDAMVSWQSAKAVDDKGQINLGQVFGSHDHVAAYGYVELPSPAARTAQLVVGSDDTLTVWLNGKQMYKFDGNRSFEPEQARMDVKLNKGANRLLVRCGNATGGWQFAVGLTAPGEHAFLKTPAAGAFNPDAYRDFALKTRGKTEHGRALFSDLKGLACVKCHSVGGQGGNVGPELSSVGTKYPKNEIIESVLYPSARISSGYEPSVIALTDGRILTGIVKSESPEAVEIEDADAKRLRLLKTDIDERKRSDVSLMPNGLAEGLSKQDFADLIAYLETLKDTPKAVANGGR